MQIAVLSVATKKAVQAGGNCSTTRRVLWVHLAPVALHIDALGRIREGFLIFTLPAIAGRAVAVEHVRRAKLDCL